MPRRNLIPREVSTQIARQARGVCAVCGSRIPPESAAIAQVDRQKENDADNLIALCMNCYHRADRNDIPQEALRRAKNTLNKLDAVASETEFLRDILKPLFEGLGYTSVEVIHHTGAPERGKDMTLLRLA